MKSGYYSLSTTQTGNRGLLYSISLNKAFLKLSLNSSMQAQVACFDLIMRMRTVKKQDQERY